jgi:hypothetical protein
MVAVFQIVSCNGGGWQFSNVPPLFSGDVAPLLNAAAREQISKLQLSARFQPYPLTQQSFLRLPHIGQ